MQREYSGNPHLIKFPTFLTRHRLTVGPCGKTDYKPAEDKKQVHHKVALFEEVCGGFKAEAIVCAEL